MELALPYIGPFIALAGLYVVSNQKNESCEKTKRKVKFSTETFENMGAKPNYLPNTDIPPRNYPILNTKELVNTVQNYPNPNSATDKYIDQSYYESQQNAGMKVGNTPKQIASISGNYMDTKEFKHNNMVPFDGGKIKGYTYDVKFSENILDNMVGTGSQIFKKVEQAPLFKPEQNMNWSYGMPNQSDFLQSRVNPGTRNNNVKPFDSINVGPGLNQGYGTNGSGGFNSGMESRDKWLPKTVDELRVETNPKMVYDLKNHEGPSYSTIKNSGIIGRVEKQRPDTFFIQTQDRWLTTTGAEKGQTSRSIQEMGILRRNNCEVNYPGPAGTTEKTAGYVPVQHETSKRQQTKMKDIPHCNAAGRGPQVQQDNLKQFTNYNNNRSTTRQADTIRSGFSSAIGAVVAPLMDVLRPSRKEEIVNNVRIYGEAGTTVPSSYVLNPNDTTATTVKETTMYSPSFNINNQKEGQYVNTYLPTDLTQRDTTSCEYVGSVGNNHQGNMVYDATYNQTNNDIKAQTIYNRPNVGGTQMFNQQMNVNCAKQDSDCFNYRMPTPASIFPMPPAKENYGNIIKPIQNNQYIQVERNSPDILNAFRQNPYTQSLTTSV